MHNARSQNDFAFLEVVFENGRFIGRFGYSSVIKSRDRTPKVIEKIHFVENDPIFVC